jgi:hypothetical protein
MPPESGHSVVVWAYFTLMNNKGQVLGVTDPTHFYYIRRCLLGLAKSRENQWLSQAA